MNRVSVTFRERELTGWRRVLALLFMLICMAAVLAASAVMLALLAIAAPLIIATALILGALNDDAS